MDGDVLQWVEVWESGWRWDEFGESGWRWLSKNGCRCGKVGGGEVKWVALARAGQKWVAFESGLRWMRGQR